MYGASCFSNTLSHVFNALYACCIPSRSIFPLQRRVQSLLNRLRVRPDNLLHLLATLKQQERRHSPDAQFLCNIRNLIDVDLIEFNRAVFRIVGPLDDLRGDRLAGAAPGGETVEEDEVGGGGGADFGLEVAGAVDGINACDSASGLGLGGDGVLRCAEFGLVIGYILCEVVDAHFGGGLFEGFGCGCRESSRCGDVRCVEGRWMKSFGSEW